MEHSDEFEDAVSGSFGLPKSRSRLCVVTLVYVSVSRLYDSPEMPDSLVIIECLLPRSIAFDLYLHTAEYHLFATSEVNS